MNNLKLELHQRFGFDTFRPGQQEVLEYFLAGEDVLAILPTGTGKSILYQFPTHYYSGTVIILSPLVSLMMDQVDQLKARGVKKVVALNSFQSPPERNYALNNLSTYDYIFLSPEVLQNDRVKNAISQLHVSYFVFDEAHCLTLWGLDFRPDYLRATEWINQQFTKQILALTATATDQTRQSLKNLFNRPAMKEVVRSIDRPSIALQTTEADNEHEKEEIILSQISRFKGPGILYTQSRKRAEYYAEKLTGQGIRAAAYHGGMPPLERSLIQQQYSHGQLDWICATNAFGMGIHKENIRQIIHDHVPTSLSNYLQEIGRASRDGKQSFATLVYLQDDARKSQFIATSDIPDNTDISLFMENQDTILDDQKRRILTYWQSRMSLEEQQQLFQNLRMHKTQEINQLFEILRSEACIRSSLTEAFGENLETKPEICCNRCTNIVQHMQTHLVNDFTKENAEQLTVVDRIKQLFP